MCIYKNNSKNKSKIPTNETPRDLKSISSTKTIEKTINGSRTKKRIQKSELYLQI
ncbi:hypothetical protein HanPSC8_Chr17g0787321 [Helianthus annuus]|nr:hypothetical protein HanPSC8_Chr17g0787321 [Helianthus annuus]